MNYDERCVINHPEQEAPWAFTNCAQDLIVISDRKYPRFLIFFPLVLASHFASALDPMRTHQNLVPLSKYYVDETGQLGFQQIRQLPRDVWVRADATSFNFGFTDTPHWISVTINNPMDTEQRLLLEIGRPLLDDVDVYVVLGKDQLRYHGGTSQPYSKRVIKHREHLFPITLEGQQSADIFIRVQNAGSLSFPLKLWHSDRFLQADKNSMLLYGAYFGIWLLVLIYNTVLYAAIANRALASFIAFVFSFGIYQLASLGLGSGYIWGKYPGLSDAAVIFGIGTAILSLMFFCNHLLKLHESNVTGLRILQFFSYPAIACMLAYPFLGYGETIPLLTALAAPNALIVLATGLRSAILGNRMGLYATIAWTPLLLGIVAIVLVRFEYLPMNFMTENAAAAGFLLMMFAISFVIAAEYRRQAQEGELKLAVAGLGSLENQKKINEQLEDMVHDRTQELETALQELSQANETLKEINTMDAVTGIKNRHYFDTIFEQEWKRASREKYPISLLLLDIDHFKQVNDKYGHLAGDECLHEVASTISAALKRPADIVARYGGEEFVAVLPYIENQNALEFANRIRSRVEASDYIVDGHKVNVTVSIGVCTVTPTDDDELKDVIAAADIALYEAKNSGRNQVRNAGQLTVHAGNIAS